MGVDIHLYIAQKNKPSEEVFHGLRNGEWFDNICGNGSQPEYDELPSVQGLSPLVDDTIRKETYNDEQTKYQDFYYNFYYINVGEFKKWFEKYRPDIDAGWVTTYDKWRIEKNKITYPDFYLSHFMIEDVNPKDQHFIEYTNRYDLSRQLYDILISKKIPDDADLTYYFDC